MTLIIYLTIGVIEWFSIIHLWIYSCDYMFGIECASYTKAQANFLSRSRSVTSNTLFQRISLRLYYHAFNLSWGPQWVRFVGEQ